MESTNINRIQSYHRVQILTLAMNALCCCSTVEANNVYAIFATVSNLSCPRWVTSSICSICITFAWPIMGKHDVIHKNAIKNILQHCQRTETVKQPTGITNLMKSGHLVFQKGPTTDRHTDMMIAIILTSDWSKVIVRKQLTENDAFTWYKCQLNDASTLQNQCIWQKMLEKPQRYFRYTRHLTNLITYLFTDSLLCSCWTLLLGTIWILLGNTAKWLDCFYGFQLHNIATR